VGVGIAVVPLWVCCCGTAQNAVLGGLRWWSGAVRFGSTLPKQRTYLYHFGDPGDDSRRWVAIEAHAGDSINKVWTTDQDPQNPDRWYTDAQLDANCTCGTHWHGDDPCTVNPAPQKYRARSLHPD
jgi:hypothetical protein